MKWLSQEDGYINVNFTSVYVDNVFITKSIKKKEKDDSVWDILS